MISRPALVVAHNLRHKSYDASYRSTTNSSVARQMQVMVQVMDSTVSRLQHHAIVMLKTRIKRIQLVAVVLLIVGMVLVEQVEADSQSGATSSSNVGVLAVFCAACTSGFTGSYLEKLYKSDNIRSIWLQNVQLSSISFPIAVSGMYWRDGKHIRPEGIFQGYDVVVLFLVILHAVGGLFVAAVTVHQHVLSGECSHRQNTRLTPQRELYSLKKK